jgi:PEGA domain
MSTLPQRPSSQPGDGLGYRVLGFDKKTGDRLEMLRVRPQFAGQPNFEAQLRTRTQRLQDFRGAGFARVRQIEKLTGQASGIAIVSNHVEGARLADLFGVADSYGVKLDSDAALSLVRQTVSTIADLHTAGPDISHGCLSPERIVVTKDGRVVVTEYILGAALEGLQWTRKQFWQDFRIALPAGPDPATIDQQTDLMQVGVLALALLAGRQVYAEKAYPLPLAERLKACRETFNGQPQPLRSGLATWLQRLLRLEGATPFSAADEALLVLDSVLATGYQASPSALAQFVDRCYQASPDLRPREMTETGENLATGAKPDTASGEKAATPHAAPTPVAATPAAPAPAQQQPAAQATPVPAKPAEPKTGSPAQTPAPAAKAPAAQPAAAKPAAPAAPIAGKKAEPTTGKPAPVDGKSAASSVAAHGLADAKDAKKPAAAAFGKAGAASSTGALLGGETMVDDASGGADSQNAPKSGSKLPLAVAAVIAILAAGGFVAFKFMGSGAAVANEKPVAMPASKGTLSIEATPKTATVYIDDAPSGTTPLKIDLPAGNHTIRLDGGEGLTRTFPVTITAGKEVSHLVELARDVQTGSLEVRTDPAGARVSIDGRGVGTSPLTLNDLQPGDHAVVVEGANSNPVRQTVKVIAGTRSSVVVPLGAATPASPAAGWLTVAADTELQVSEGGQLLGTSRTDKIMMPAGDHNLEFSNESLGFHAAKSVSVQPGKVAKVSVPLPDGTISVNATPWADVLVDGVSAGQTPVGNLSAKAGTHEVVFRHPKFGEKKQSVVVKPGQAARVTIDMTK